MSLRDMGHPHCSPTQAALEWATRKEVQVPPLRFATVGMTRFVLDTGMARFVLDTGTTRFVLDTLKVALHHLQIRRVFVLS